jgi:hypothetical protein
MGSSGGKEVKRGNESHSPSLQNRRQDMDNVYTKAGI